MEHLLLHLGVDLLALLAVVLGGLRLAHGGETGEGVAYLLLNLVVVNLNGLLIFFLFLLFATGSLLLLGGETLTLLLGLFLLFALLFGYLCANLFHLLGADGFLLGMLALAFATGGIGTVLGELAEVNFVEYFGTFKFLVLSLDEFGLLFGFNFRSFNLDGLWFWFGLDGFDRFGLDNFWLRSSVE